MTEVYLVTRGSYSDYRVVGVFSTRELAEQFCVGDSDYNDVMPLEMDSNAEQIRSGLLPYSVAMYRNGVVWYADRTDKVFNQPKLVGQIPNQYLSGDVWATNIEHATKILSDIRAQLIADNQWVSPMDDI